MDFPQINLDQFSSIWLSESKVTSHIREYSLKCWHLLCLCNAMCFLTCMLAVHDMHMCQARRDKARLRCIRNNSGVDDALWCAMNGYVIHSYYHGGWPRQQPSLCLVNLQHSILSVSLPLSLSLIIMLATSSWCDVNPLLFSVYFLSATNSCWKNSPGELAIQPI